ncbi:hypothetical protein F511_39699 [Dorcoceras hygrometricum]|uniref:Uncharacterized protein n=1 Tax=Dorcoceras hygrometricum TaxID=472368 RepID=A0A2Z7CI64_9LAMI|nr:hypothetical protein F511_39699 [Dorcoceras hygrometricum]
MEVGMSNPTEINRVDLLCKKRKIRREPVGVPLPKHVRWGQVVEHDLSSDSDTKMGGELERECVRNSINSLQSNIESTMFTCNEGKTDPGNPENRPSDESSSSSSRCIEGGSITKQTLSESEMSSEHDADHLRLRSLSDSGCSDYAEYMENLLVYNILSSRRWSGDEDGGKRLTIDEEFEEYFSMLML